jgi:riboflavin kinase/FMN adenylyltransferase
VRVVRTWEELEQRPRAVAVGSFDGVHTGHRRVLAALASAGPAPTVVTYGPHRSADDPPALICTLERRLELLSAAGVAETLVLAADAAAAPAGEVAERLQAVGAAVAVAGPPAGGEEAELLTALVRSGVEVREVARDPAVSSKLVREAIHGGRVEEGAALLGRPPEVEGVVVSGDRRGTILGYPTANLAPPGGVVVPSHGIYAGEAEGHRVAMSIGVNPHYGAGELRLEAFLLDFDGDLYGRRLVVELWQRLRDEQAFGSEAELVDQIGRDVAAARAAVRPA